MPGGGSILGFGYFAAVKAAGYVGASAVLKRKYETTTNVWAAGLTRTAIGIAVGVTYGLLIAFSERMAVPSRNFPLYFFPLLIPLRIAEWYFFIWLFFDRTAHKPRIWYWVGAGIVWSFVLDAIAIFAAFAIPGGMWIC
jgi:hypothetical protein